MSVNGYHTILDDRYTISRPVSRLDSSVAHGVGVDLVKDEGEVEPVEHTRGRYGVTVMHTGRGFA